MIDTALLKAMARAGVTADQIAIIAAEYDSATAESRAEKREQNRIRQQNHRSRNSVSRVTECDTPPLDKENTPTPLKETKPSPLISPPTGGVSPAEIEKAIEVYSETAARCGLPVPRAITPQRRKKIAGVLRAHGLDAWTEAVQRMGSSEFCCGKNERGWRADLEFLLQPTSFMRLIEGQYGGSAVTNSGGDTFCAADDPQTRWHVIRYHDEHDGADPPPAAYGGKAGYMIPATWVKAMQMRQANG